MSESSYRTILRSSAIIAGGQAINLVANLFRMKVLAVLLGPVGVGLAGLFISLIQTASTVAAFGLTTVGQRQIAAAHASGDEPALARSRQALFWGTLIMALAGGLAFWAARVWVADIALGDSGRGNEVGWLAIGVVLTVAAGSQGALLSGFRRIGDLAQMQAVAGIIGSILGVAALWLLGSQGIVAMVLIGPVVGFVLGHAYVRRLPRRMAAHLSIGQFAREFRAMACLGLAVMASTLATLAGQLIVRILVRDQLGADNLGYFQAAWAISVTYLGFVLGAMGTDYFPRLSAIIHHPEMAIRLINEQTEVALLLCGPVLIALLGLAPWVISILYSNAFAPAVDILRWQLLGGILKVMSWPLGFALLAIGAGRSFFMAEVIGVGTLLIGVAIGLPVMGLEATGLAFVAMYLAYLPAVLWLCARRIGFFWSKAVMVQAACTLALALLIVGIASTSPALGAVCSVAIAAMSGAWALARISAMAGLEGRFASIARLSEKAHLWLAKRL
jgi:PST family polysaccharide transporter